MTGLPVNGSTVHYTLHYTLFYKKGAGNWQSVASTYTAAGTAPAITSPAAGSTLSGPNQLFEWAGGGVSE